MTHSTVRLGLMPPFTGIVGIYGQEIARAGEIACQEINESGGVLGRPLEIIIEDDGSLPESAVRAAEKLLNQHGCKALIGNLMTNSRIAVTYRVAEPRKIPYLCFSLYEGSVLSRYYFHFAALPNQQIDLVIPYMRSQYGPKMFFCGNNYEWPRGSIDAAKRALAKAKGENVGEEYYPIEISQMDAKRLIHNVLRSGAHVLAPFFAGSDEITVLTQFVKAGLKNKVQVIMTHYDEIMASGLSPEARDGLYSTNSYFMTVDTPENRAFLKKLSVFSGVKGLWPRGNGILTNFGEGTYLCVKAYAKAANLARSLDSEAIVAALESVSVTGPQGTVTMDPATHHAKVHSYFARGQADGTFRIIKDFGIIDPIIPQRYRHIQITPEPSADDLRVQARIVEQMTDSVCLIETSNSTFIYVNPAFERMFGYNKDETIGKHPSFLILPGSTSAATADEINKVLYQCGIWKGEIEFVKKDGTPFWCSAVISAFTHGYYGEVWIAILRDITESKRTEEALVNAKKAAENAMRVKSRFIDIAAHELRTPVSSFSLLLELVQRQLEKNGQPVTISTLEKLRAQANRLFRLVVDLLDVSRLEHGTFNLRCAPNDLTSIVCECLDTYRLQAPLRNFTFSKPAQPVECNIDRDRILQVISNFLDNALKYTQKDSPIEVSIEVTTDLARISVKDYGPGLDEKQQTGLFNPFERGTGPQEKQVGGLGLGLFVCRGIIELHGGKIGVKSKLGSGSTFFFELPRNIASTKAA